MNGGLRPYDIRTEPCTALDAPGQERPELFCCLHGMAGAGSCPRVPAPAYLPPLTFTVFLSVSVCRRLPGEPKELRWGPAPHPSHGLAILAGLLLPRRKAPDD